jgi:serine/threonine protein kinase
MGRLGKTQFRGMVESIKVKVDDGPAVQKYRWLEDGILGGGKGDVAAVIDLLHDPQVKRALKIHGVLDENGLREAHNEFKVLMGFNCSNLVGITDHGEIKDEKEVAPFLVMEKGDFNLEMVVRYGKEKIQDYFEDVPPEVLDNIFEKDGSIKDSFLFSSIEDILNGLGYLESQNKVHRDVKPNNIIVFHEGEKKTCKAICKLADFEEVRSIDELYSQTGTHGTVSHMAPEQKDFKKEVNFSSDLYSVALVFYQMLTRTSSSSLCGKSRNKLIEEGLIKEGDEYPDIKLNPEAFLKYLELDDKVKNRLFNAIIRKALSFDKDLPEGRKTEGRYQTAKEFLDDIKIARRYKEYDAIETALNTDLTSEDVVEDRRRAKDKWRKTFTDVFSFENDEQYKSQRRGKNWLLDKFEDEAITSKVKSDLRRIDKLYKDYNQKVNSEENDRKKISGDLRAYADIWDIYSELVQGNVDVAELTPSIKEDLKVIKDAEGNERKQTPAERLRELANEYDPEQKLTLLINKSIKNEDDLDYLEKEIDQYVRLNKISKGREKKKIEVFREKIATYRKKAREVCTKAKAKYHGLSEMHKFDPKALDIAWDILDSKEYKECHEFYQVAAAKAELIYLDITIRKMCGETDKIEILEKEAEQDLAGTGGREYACTEIARELAGREKTGREEWRDLVMKKGQEYFEKKDYDNALLCFEQLAPPRDTLGCFEQLSQKDKEAVVWMGKTVSSIGDGIKDCQERAAVYDMALKYCDSAAREIPEAVVWQERTNINRKLKKN